MDAKKKRNKKKKGNQGKNTGDVTSNAGEAAPQHHNYQSAPADRHKGSDADDVMSSVGEGAAQHQSHVPTPLIDGDGTNARDTASSVGEVIVCCQNNEPTMSQENHKVNNAIPPDQRSNGMSESSVELDIHKLNDAKLSILESELEKLHIQVDCHIQNEVLFEEKLNSLQNGYDLLVKKEEVLDNKVRRIEDTNGTLTHQEASFKERLSGLEETNKALQLQVKVLEETSNNTAEENKRLVKSLNELDSRVQALEAKVKVPEHKVMDQKDLAGPLLHQQARCFDEAIGMGNEMIDRGLDSSVTIVSDNNYSQINNSPSNVYASNHLEETSLQYTEKASDPSNTSIAQGLIDVNDNQFDEQRTSEEIVPVPLDDIQIHEYDAQQSAGDETAEVPFSDAPIIGAPFRLISFVARYVSGADLVGEK